LFCLADSIDWKFFDEELGTLYAEMMGRPSLPIRLLVAMRYLKQVRRIRKLGKLGNRGETG